MNHALNQALARCDISATDALIEQRDQQEQTLREEIARERSTIKTDEEQFKRLGLPVTSDAFETWETLADDQRSDFERGIILSALNLGLEAITMASGPIGSFTPPKANALISWLRSKGVTIPFLEEGIRKVAMTSGKPEMMKNVRDLAETIGHGVDIVNLSSAQVEALVTIPAAIVLKSPEAKAMETLGETVVNFVFAEKAFGVIDTDLNSVLSLPEQQLENVRRLSAEIKADVGDLSVQKRTLNAIVAERVALESRARQRKLDAEK